MPGNPSVLTTLTEARSSFVGLKSEDQELVQPYSFVRSCCGPNFETRRAEESPFLSGLVVCHSLNPFCSSENHLLL